MSDPSDATGPLGPNGLDFWLGDWDLRWGPEGRGRNRIQRRLGDRVIIEEFEGQGRAGDLLGLSLSVLDVGDGVWRQTWVDSEGSYLDLVGVEVGGRLSFQRETIEDGVAVVQRMIWRDVTADSLVWEWQRSTDAGATWTAVWVIDYTRRS